MLRVVAALLWPAAAASPYVAAWDEWDGVRGSLARVGDIDDDGIADFALARRPIAPLGFGKPPSPPPAGAVWILSGCNGAVLRTVVAPEPCVDFGRTVEDVGDLDGDRRTDLAVSGCGTVWAFSGATGEVLRELEGPGGWGGFGVTVAGGLDITGDAIPDLLVYRRNNTDAPDEPFERGVVFAYSGASGELVRVIGSVEERPAGVPLEVSYTRILSEGLLPALSLVPDRDGDSLAEIAVTVAMARDPRTHETGIDVAVLSGDRKLLRFPVKPSYGGFGAWVLRSLPDVDGDDTAELLCSVVHEYVACYSGLSGMELRHHSFDGVAMNGEGTTLDALGDVNGDGHADYLMGANEDAFILEPLDPGLVAIYSGATGETLSSIDYMPVYIEELGETGIGVDACAIGDANGDGISDVAVHMPRLREARVLSGKDLAVITVVDLSELEPFERR